MTTEEREALRAQLDDLDRAEMLVLEAQEAVGRVRRALEHQHEAEILCHCEDCGAPILFGDLAFWDGQGGVGFCVDHAPTWLDAAHVWTEVPFVADQDPDDVARAHARIERHVERGGLMRDKQVWEV